MSWNYKILWRQRGFAWDRFDSGIGENLWIDRPERSKIHTENIHHLIDYHYWGRDIGLYVQLVA
jgi:hypothetical protein